ncbi:MAG TPA: fused response regulator/phosphatase [Sulfuricella sp.]|nr:fused response regulator/phosphatase [Sulfuricella sp.]
MKILIAEHNPTGLNLLIQMLELDGHDVIPARTHQEALARFVGSHPDMVLLDVGLPDADGHHCAAEIKRLSPKRFVPVILATSITDHLTLSRFLESGADDFIDQPYSHMVLKAKIAGFERVQQLYRRLEKFRTLTEQEINVAKHMFDAITQRSPTGIPNLHHWTLAAGHFCGDLLVFERTPDDHLHILLGDFTGHGLPAAVGALPTSDIFFAMTQKGLGIGEIAGEINRKLHHVLPTGHFCAACLVSISPQDDRLEIWNGGLPPVLLVNDRHEVIHSLPSDKLALGVIGDDGFDSSTLELSTKNAHHLILYSDGLVEAQNADGEAFGDHGLADVLRITTTNSSIIQSIKSGVITFLDGLEPHDDISLLAVNLGTPL